MKHYRSRYFCSRDNKVVPTRKVFKVCLMKADGTKICNFLKIRKGGKYV